MLGEPNGGVYYQTQYTQPPAFIEGVKMWRVIRAAEARQQRKGKLLAWLALIGFKL